MSPDFVTARSRSFSLLQEHLTSRQQSELQYLGYFRIKVRRYIFRHTYRIRDTAEDNVVLEILGIPVLTYCRIFKGYAPKYDLLLAQKLTLEICPRKYFRKAISLGGVGLGFAIQIGGVIGLLAHSPLYSMLALTLGFAQIFRAGLLHWFFR